MAETLYAIDAYAHLYQFFYAIKGLTGPDGEPVNALYGFARMIEHLLKEHRPDYLVVALDGGGELARHRLYEGYKANRPPMPEDLERQLPLVFELLDAWGIPRLSVEGHEADDVIAALARQAAGQGMRAVIVTTDKDAEQLIDEHTSVLHIHKDEEILMDLSELKLRKGIEPWQVVEVMALAGDSTDNVPGVPGVGPKTALKLIQQFGSVQNLYKNLDRIPSDSLRSRLAEHRADVELASQLVKLNPDIPLQLDLQRARVAAFDRKKVNQFYRAVGFHSLMRDDVPASPQTPAKSPTAGGGAAAMPKADDLSTLRKDYSVVANADALRKVASTLAERDVIAVDLETTSLHPRSAQIVGFAFSWQPHQAVYVATAGPAGAAVCPLDEAMAILKPILESERPAKVGQNLKYDIAVLKNVGVELRGLQCDCMVASYLLHPSDRSHGLDALALRHLNYQTIKISELIGKGAEQLTMDQVPVEAVGPYACEDADLAFILSEMLCRRLKEEGLYELFSQLEMPLVPVLADMEWTGVKVDTAQLRQLSQEFAAELDALEGQIFQLAGCQFNINSPRQLSHVLFDQLGLPSTRGTARGTARSTASDVLETLRAQHPIVDLILRHRELTKLKSTYADALLEMVHPVTGRIHGSFNQTGTATGRLSSSDPNLQNIPVRTPLGRRIRQAFVPSADDMSLLSADYSQVELRIMAHCSGDPALKLAFAQDQDIHRFVASQIYGVPLEQVTDQMRQQAKAVNFGIIYGQTPYGLARQIGISQQEAEQFIARYFERYPKVKDFIQRTVAEARRQGYVSTLSGRRRTVEGIRSTGATRSAAERIAVNTVIQGSAADLIKGAMVRIHRGLPAVSRRARLLLQIHDELVLEAPDAEVEPVRQFVAEQMSGALKLDIPLKVDTAVGKNWAEAK